MASPDGAASRSTATRRSRRRSRMAFMACVVPTITWVTRPAVRASSSASTPASAVRTPDVTSGVVGTFTLATT